mmetsp:Transcript_1483/g.3249  ORF Transcript_1483/g.3249 Transcript_1483/m.3249 type:complete len:233 (+) Transcript_1483:47-745(+)
MAGVGGAVEGVSTGTTILAATYDGGVVLGADSRTSTGNYVANKTADKITKVCDRVYLCRSGSAAHTQAVSAYANLYLNQHAIELGHKGVRVRTAANIVKEIAYSNKGWMMAGMIVAGWDVNEGGKVFAITLGGTMMDAPFATGGSGSVYINAYCDKNFKPNMTKEECKAFVRKAVSLAISRDGSSGGVIRTITVDKDEQVKEFVPGDVVPVYQDEVPVHESRTIQFLSSASV